MSRSLLLEVCVDSIDSAWAACYGGADRLELCGNLGIGGGTTPSMGLFRLLRKRMPDMPIMVMIRPRAGDFVYSEQEVQTMCEDIREFKAAGATGFVLGSLNASDGSINEGYMSWLLQAASNHEVCFHRAFDMIPPEKAEDSVRLLESMGITRILTSGLEHSAPSALSMIGSLSEWSIIASEGSGRSAPMRILPGSGINSTTIAAVTDALLPKGIVEFHMSGGRWIESEATYRRPGMGMGVGGAGEWCVWKTDREEVEKVKRYLQKLEI